MDPGRGGRGEADPSAVQAGLPNLERHLESIETFGLEAVVALNHFDSDSDAEIAVVDAFCRERGVPMAVCRGWAEGGARSRSRRARGF
jgi:formate--tetrahydrofolate ligase